MADKVAKILELLSDGEWHTVEEIKQKMKLDDRQVEGVMEFLESYSFIKVDEGAGRVMLNNVVRRFWGGEINP